MGITYRSRSKVYPRGGSDYPGLARRQRTRRARDPAHTHLRRSHRRNGRFHRLVKAGHVKSFHQIALHPNSRKYATFSTPRGLRRCTTLVMGFTNASEILQRVMSMVLSSLCGVSWIHDDITICGCTVRKNNERLAACLLRLQKYNITLNKAKYIFGVDKVTFMAMQLSSKGIQPSQQKVVAIKYLSAFSVSSTFSLDLYPTSPRKQSPSGASHVQVVSGSGPKQKSFNTLKNSISSASCLVFFDKDRKTELRVNASPVGLKEKHSPSNLAV